VAARPGSGGVGKKNGLIGGVHVSVTRKRERFGERRI
jgi:hypothetical protein